MFCEREEETKWRKYSSGNLIALISDTFQLYCADGDEWQVSFLFTTENRQGFIFSEELHTAFFCHQQKKIPEQPRLILFNIFFQNI